MALLYSTNIRNRQSFRWIRNIHVFFFLAVQMTVQAQSYTSYFTGSNVDVVTSPKGGICMMGGASENDNAMKWFLNNAAGGDILVLRASGADGYNNYLYSQLGVSVNSVETILCNNSSCSNESYIAQKINQAEGIWFAGGDQWDYVSYWRGTPLDSLINLAIQNRNIVIGGTSAGMVILGKYYFSAQNGTVSSASALANPYGSSMKVDSTRFLVNNYLEDVITDTHFDSPIRKGRLAAFLARILKDYGVVGKAIACDEYTAVCVDSTGLARVYGNYPVDDDNAYFVQPNCELPNMQPETCVAGMPLTWNKNGQALKVYRVKGTQNGTNAFQLTNWTTGSGGEWQHWSVNSASFTETTAQPINCITEVDESSAFSNKQPIIYPNPTTANFALHNIAHNIIHMEIYTINGTPIIGFTTPLSLASNSFDISILPHGAYILKIKTEQEQFTKLLIKN